MSEQQVTITLGRSGQVVKRPRGARNDSQTLSGGKRSLADDSFLSINKRARGVNSSRSSGHNGKGARIGKNDLRLKLTRKRMSESQRKTEIHKKISRAIQSVENSEKSSVIVPLIRSSNELQRIDSLMSSYSPRAADGFRLEPSDMIARASAQVAAVRYKNEMQRLPSSRPIETFGNGRVMSSDVLNPSRSKISVHIPTRIPLDARKLVTEFPATTSSILRSSQLSLTVSSFLHSLGLEKYAIHFQAEEVDMTALKQMGDRDLKELGLPMGPRKKILLALLPPAKRSTA